MGVAFRSPSGRALRGACVGSFVEWFDFGIYAYLAPIIAANFFPAAEPTAGLLGAFALFAVAFLSRPLGGIVLGHYGDRIGRRAVLAFSVITMAGATAAIGLLPTFAAAGVVAPLLLLLCRLLQGFSAGGEYMGAASFAIEHAPAGRHGRYAGVLGASVIVGFVVAALFITALTALVGNAGMAAWGWRIPFLIALPLGLIGLYLRSRVSETPEFRALQAATAVVRTPIREAFRTERGAMVRLVGLSLPFVVGIYLLLTYTPTYLGRLGVPVGTALLSNAAVLVPVAVGMVAAGIVSDRHGKWPVMVAGTACFLVLPPLAFLVMGAGGVGAAVAGQLLLAVPVAITGGVYFVVLVEAFPVRLRFSAGSIAYGFAQAVFGGTAPFVATLLVARTGSDLAPAWYVTLLAVVALPVALTALRTRPAVLPR
ncbi:MFS transporter [Pseudonocardia kunmingensis]|uniref:Putative proline/betaine transporter n=1 Tax=Pseudonocardia kunmingensis TaxID=630975 RepID=A0A543DQ63_9PSEU|nr:MFS transporter [Pseudonocardia kunmingensis]TQM11449.1 MHS family proline/betaine transporter-like MFS transporter [Pseudonocardia kunmingensis]